MIRKTFNYFKKLIICLMIIGILTPEFYRIYYITAYALDNVELKDSYGKYYNKDLLYNETKNNNNLNNKADVITKSPTIINKNNKKVLGYEILSKRTENSKTYKVNNLESVTEVYLDTIHKKIDNVYLDIDNTLVDNNNYINNKFGLYDIKFYKDDKYLYNIKDLSIRYDNGNVSNYKYENNKILYSNVYNNVDIEYVLNNTYLKENIIFNSNMDTNTFSYIMNIGDYNIKKEDNYICI